MKIYQDLISNITARINLRTNNSALPAAVRCPIGGSLIYYYTLLALTRGTDTTSEDAHSAWLMWLASQGGEPSNIETIIEITDMDKRVAAGICDAARYRQQSIAIDCDAK